MKYYKLHLIRHGLTQGNLDGRYIGSGTDLPLCAEGRAQLEELTILQDLREMNFGKFENRPITELVKDPEFAQWMDPTSRTNPDGAEDRKAFYDRTNVMLMKLFEYQPRTHTEEAACITHGGVIMNMMANHVLPQHKPEEWMTDPGCGYSLRLDAEMWMRDHIAEAFDIVPYGYLDGAEE